MIVNLLHCACATPLACTWEHRALCRVPGTARLVRVPDRRRVWVTGCRCSLNSVVYMRVYPVIVLERLYITGSIVDTYVLADDCADIGSELPSIGARAPQSHLRPVLGQKSGYCEAPGVAKTTSATPEGATA